MESLEAWMPRLVRAFRRLGGPPQARGRPVRLERAELARVAAGVRKLSAGLTRDRELVGAGYLNDPALLGAYLLFYWPVSYAQVRAILPELPRTPRKVLDLGGGAGPAAFACLDAGADEAVVADRSGPALDVARELGRERGKAVGTQRWTGGGPPGTGLDLIVAQHLMNELWRESADRIEKRTALVHALLGRLRPGGTLLLVDPALRETSRELLELRDRLAADGIAVRAPCLFRGGCPALLRPTDWCHAERSWEPPPLVAEIAREAGLHKDALKMSYLALARPGEAWQDPPPGRVFRIVSEPLAGKGRRRYMGCGPDGRMGLALQDKHVAEGNRAFLELARGEVVRVTGCEPKGDGVGLGPQSTVEQLAHAGEPLPAASSVGR